MKCEYCGMTEGQNGRCKTCGAPKKEVIDNQNLQYNIYQPSPSGVLMDFSPPITKKPTSHSYYI